MQVKQQKKDYRSKVRQSPLHPGGTTLLNKSSGGGNEREMFSLGEGKGYISDKTLIKKRYVGNIGKGKDGGEEIDSDLVILGKRQFKDAFNYPNDGDYSGMGMFQLKKEKQVSDIKQPLPDVPEFESNH